MHVALAVLVALCAVFSLTSRSVKASTPQIGASDNRNGSVSLKRELKDRRSQYSRTYVASEGGYLTRIYGQSINYRVGNKWRQIDRRLTVADKGFHNSANRFNLFVPNKLDSSHGIRVSKGSSWASLALQGADGTVQASGRSAKVDEAMPGVDLNIISGADNVGLQALISSASVKLQYRIDTSINLGLRKTRNGHINLLDSHKRVYFTISSSGSSFNPSFKVRKEGNHWLLTIFSSERQNTMSPSRLSLSINVPDMDQGGPSKGARSSEKTGPIHGAFQDCTIVSSPLENKNFCGPGDETLQVGNQGGKTYRSLIQFNAIDDLGHVLSDLRSSEVLFARMGLHFASQSTSNPAPVNANRLTQYWEKNYVTWNTASLGTAWNTPGGQFANPPVATVKEVGPLGDYESWYITQQVKDWITGIPNFGLLLQQATPTDQLYSFDSSRSTGGVNVWPLLEVRYYPRTGSRRQYQFEGINLNDRMSAAVNVASGDLLLSADDLETKGRNINLKIARQYNSLAAPTQTGTLGTGWTMDTGADMKLEFFNDGSVAFHGPSGYVVPFTKALDGNRYIAPSGIDATLTLEADNTFTLKMNKQPHKYIFDALTGQLKEQSDENDAITGQKRNSITYSYRSDGKLDRLTDSQNRTVIFQYNADGYLSKMQDSAGRTWRYSYDDNNRLISYTDANSKVTKYTYSGSKLQKVTDPKNVQTEITYEPESSKVTSVTQDALVAPQATKFYYKDDVAIPNTVVTDPRMKQTTYEWDAFSRVAKTIDPISNTESQTYTINSDIASKIDGFGNTTRFDYDSPDSLNPNNRLVKVTNPTSSTETISYADPSHPYYPTKHIDTGSNSNNYSYRQTGAMSLMWQGSNSANSAKLEYNADGTPKSSTDANGNVTTYTYDSNGYLRAVTYPSPLRTEAYAWDKVGRLISKTDGKGQTTRIRYDNLDRIERITYSDGSTVFYKYDANGNIIREIDSTGAIHYSYDGKNRLTQEINPNGTINRYKYDKSGNPVSLSDTGGTTRYSYNDADRLVSVTEPGNRTTNFVYNTNGQRKQTSYPNGVVVDWSYDESKRVTAIHALDGSHKQIVSLSYNYRRISDNKDVNDVQSVTDNLTGKTISYTYDDHNRLIQATSPDGTYSYSYDATGNRTRNGAITYQYNAANQLTSINNTTLLQYDDNGGLTGIGGTLGFSYNTKDQTTQITPSGGSPIPMLYKGKGQKVRTKAGPTSYLINVLGVGGEKTGSKTTFYTRDNNGDLISQRAPDGHRYYYITDRLGSTIMLTDEKGAVAATYQYDPFGNNTKTTGSIANPWRFTGEYLDSTTGLYKMGERYYDPSIARWSQQDPIFNPMDPPQANRYSYVGNNPVNYVDPNGQRPVLPCFKKKKCRHNYVVKQMKSVTGGQALATAGLLCLVIPVVGEACGTVTVITTFIYEFTKSH